MEGRGGEWSTSRKWCSEENVVNAEANRMVIGVLMVMWNLWYLRDQLNDALWQHLAAHTLDIWTSLIGY